MEKALIRVMGVVELFLFSYLSSTRKIPFGSWGDDLCRNKTYSIFINSKEGRSMKFFKGERRTFSGNFIRKRNFLAKPTYVTYYMPFLWDKTSTIRLNSHRLPTTSKSGDWPHWSIYSASKYKARKRSVELLCHVGGWNFFLIFLQQIRYWVFVEK